MDLIAEHGVAAHWKYKENSKTGVDTDRLGDKDDLTWLRGSCSTGRARWTTPASSWSRCASR